MKLLVGENKKVVGIGVHNEVSYNIPNPPWHLMACVIFSLNRE